jgi:hypothetical protein
MHAEDSTCRGPSSIIWGDISEWQDDMRAGRAIVIFDDFVTPYVHATTVVKGGKYTLQDTGVLIRGDSTAVNTVNELGVTLFSNAAANEEGHMQWGSGSGAFRISPNDGQKGKVAFEARIKVNSIAANAAYLFFGLGTGTVAADYLVDDTGALIATEAFVGFRADAATAAGLDTIYQEASQTIQEVEANSATLVADTWTKIGYLYDPTQVDKSKRIRFFQDGTEISAANSTQLANATLFPDTGLMSPMILYKAGAGTGVLRADWVTAGMYMQSVE